ncbi:MAG: hypothetical protein U0487_03175 [Patescibacteria group bacterium]
MHDQWYERLIERGETPQSARARMDDALAWSKEAHLSTIDLDFVPNAATMEDKYHYILRSLNARFSQTGAFRRWPV